MSSLVNFPAKYRTLLKLIRRAACERPHYLQEMRHLLSRPLVLSPLVECDDVLESGAVIQRLEPLTVDNYLSAPPSRIHRINKNLLHHVCVIDLRQNLDQPADHNQPNVLQQQVKHFRELSWLQSRLEEILSEKTTAHLRDSFFVNAPGAASEDSFVRNTDIDADDSGSDIATTESATVSPLKNAVGADSSALASAGAQGIQSELWVDEHLCQPFPLSVQYLEDIKALDLQKIRGGNVSSQGLASMLQDVAQTSVFTRNEDVKLTVTIEPFDEDYSAHVHAGYGYFKHAHQLFMAVFNIEALRRDYVVHVCNTYLTQLDVVSNTLFETVGHVDATDVVYAAQRNVLCGLVADFREGPVAADEDDDDGKPPAHDEEAGEDTECPLSHEVALSNPRTFRLLIPNPSKSDNAMLMKGLVYYKVGKANNVDAKPIKVIAFGGLSLDPFKNKKEV